MRHEHHSESEECRELVARLSEYLDEELPDELCARIEGHFEDCPPCREFLDSLRHTVGWLCVRPCLELPIKTREQLKTLLAARRADER